MSRLRPGYWDDERDPGNLRYYAACRAAKEQIEAELGPAHVRVSYVGYIVGGWTMIWYFGKSETGFASGATVEAALAQADRLVFRGL